MEIVWPVYEPAAAAACFAFFRAFFCAARFLALAGSEASCGVPDLDVPGVSISLATGVALGLFDGRSLGFVSSPYPAR